jgi:hypothetical protein
MARVAALATMIVIIIVATFIRHHLICSLAAFAIVVCSPEFAPVRAAQLSERTLHTSQYS